MLNSRNEGYEKMELSAVDPNLRRVLTSRQVGANATPVRPKTADNYIVVARGFMGYLTKVRGHLELCEGLRLEHAVPSKDAAGAVYAVEYLQWLCEERGINPRTEDFQIRGLISLATYLRSSDDLLDELRRHQRHAR